MDHPVLLPFILGTLSGAVCFNFVLAVHRARRRKRPLLTESDRLRRRKMGGP